MLRLVEIPAGDVSKIGRNDGTPQERPQHAVTVQTVLIDRAEVTNEEYRLQTLSLKDGWEDKRPEVKEVDAKPVGSFPEGPNRWVVVDLIGNVREWTSSLSIRETAPV